ncbi:hypothetical protein QZH41_017136 [Actinostola sp. cb2023]|nr:hypothetical protein QZH41_017136 [Actinostola sp. cb2023]
MTVVRRPQGKTEGGTAQTLRITVKDIDNFPPTFGQDVYYGRVAERSPPNTVVDGIEKCFAVDRDSSGIDQYKIASGNEHGNNEDQDRYSRHNDHTPVFEKNKYSATVVEDIAVQTAILRVSAKDDDVGTNGGVYYYLSPLSDYFMVHAITGVIKVAQPLDYSKRRTHTLTVFARDRGSPSKSSSTTVEIKIREDIRSYPPTDTPTPGQNTRPFFPEGSYITSIREDFPTGGALLLIRAADNDTVGPNKRLTYTLSGVGSTDFLINPSSGLVTLAKSVDYKSGGSNKYSLTVRATDGSGQSAQSQLTVDVQDVDENHNSPIFSPQQKLADVAEDAAVETSVITATDKDGSGSPDGTVVYSIVQGSGMGVFKVNPSSGKIETAAPLIGQRKALVL